MSIHDDDLDGRIDPEDVTRQQDSDDGPGPTGHPSQAEGEDPDRSSEGKDAAADGHPSQAEGE